MPDSVTIPDHLYHWTCSHGRAGIGFHGEIRPWPQITLVKYALIWLTDLTDFHPQDLGLQSTIITCDRTEYCYEIDRPATAPIFSWRDWCSMVHLDRTVRSELEFGRRHAHWWVGTQPLEARLVTPNPHRP